MFIFFYQSLLRRRQHHFCALRLVCFHNWDSQKITLTYLLKLAKNNFQRITFFLIDELNPNKSNFSFATVPLNASLWYNIGGALEYTLSALTNTFRSEFRHELNFRSYQKAVKFDFF